MATYSTSALIDEILDKAKDSSIPRSRILTYLQRTQDTILGRYRFKFCETRIVRTLTIGSVLFEPPTDYQQSFQVVLTAPTLGTPAQPVFLSNVEFFERFPATDTYNPGCPLYYTDFGGDLYWDRPLDVVYTLGLRYITASPTLTDSTSSTPIIPVEFSELYIRGGLAGVEEYRENLDISAVHQRRVEDIAEDMLGRYGLRKMQPGKARPMRRSY